MSTERRCTYRLQLRPGFGFAEATELIPYLSALGVSHVYTSPVLEAEPGSQHGYDTVDHARVRSELGGEEGMRAFGEALGDAGMAWIVDIVPNHMSVASHHNRWWWDVLRLGVDSPTAPAFDIEWSGDPPKVVLPVLGRELGEVLAEGELGLDTAPDGSPALRYWDRFFPLRPESEADAGELEPAELLEMQHYHLVHWLEGATERNYRCFFDIAGLAGVRVELQEVFWATHRLVLGWLERGLVDGVRVDHVDGLADPLEYLTRLREAAPGAWILVEKILTGDEEPPRGWPVDGTTGYWFARLVDGVLIDGSAAGHLDATYRSFTGDQGGWQGSVTEAKRRVVEVRVPTDVARVARRLCDLATERLGWIPFDTEESVSVVSHALRSLDVYRTYVRAGQRPTPSDQVVIREMLRRLEARDGLRPELVELLGAALTGRVAGEAAEALVRSFQQLSGVIMAKGVEDTAFYRFNRFVALNEVGGEPEPIGLEVAELHRTLADRAMTHPYSLLSGSTHDSKRSHDLRARLLVLSECPEAWADAVTRWSRLNAGNRTSGVPGPDVEYLLYQTLVGAWPVEPERVVAYMNKACREAGIHTSWRNPDPGFEEALEHFVVTTMANPHFVADLEGFVAPLVEPGLVNSLAQTLLRLTAPGVPDVYQGEEITSRSLVDPDNRRPVDYELRRNLLERLVDIDAEQAWAQGYAGVAKLWMIRRVLGLRARRPELFAGGGYWPLHARGSRAENLIAFMRGDSVVTVVPRLSMTVAGDWGSTSLPLPAGSWRDTLSGTEVGGPAHVSTLFERFPVALLERTDDPE